MSKVIALLPFKNEERFLPSYMDSVSLVADKLIAVDDYSTDNSVKIINKKSTELNFEVDIITAVPKRPGDWYVDKTRQLLLDYGRKDEGTHFICLDADECFTKPFSLKIKNVISNLKPGFKVRLQWLAMWKSNIHYRSDNSVWSNNYKDFIFCDDGKINYKDAYLCEPRTPGENNEDNTLTLNPKYGAVMHFQFSDWNKFQLKQCWYRCREKLSGKISDAAINKKYKITLDDPNAIVEACPEEWIPKHSLPSLGYDNLENNWHFEQIKTFFLIYGKETFKQLNIWHVECLHRLL